MATTVFYLKFALQGGRRSVQLASGILGKSNRVGAAVAGVSRRGIHSASVYDKNLDDGVRPAAPVPDDVIGGPQYYWEPNPATGVFGPASAPDQHQQLSSPHRPGSTHAGSGSSVLDQTAWFRAVDGVDY